MKIVSIVGARPQFIKAAVVSRAIASSEQLREVMVHTGQHFDANMSEIFFEELGIPPPAFNLGIGGGTHAQNTGRMLEAIEGVLLQQQPDWVLVYGDTDSTLAGTVAAVKLHLKVAHVEAGLRSFNRRMPEEINRVLTDHAATLLFAPTAAAVNNLRAEGIAGGAVKLVGDVMYDAALLYGAHVRREPLLAGLGIEPKGYFLATIHRPSNSDRRESLSGLLEAFAHARAPIIWPMHPRTRRRIAEFGLQVPVNVQVIDPVGYLDMVFLEKHAQLILTDSGGVQKEAFFHRVPCLTIREQTEWVELVDLGVNHLIGDNWPRLAAVLAQEPPRFQPSREVQPYGDGNAARRIVAALVEQQESW
jgi:UDP-GlcNAc3NAcA epimerase